jgi:hypothetical protein
VTSCARGWLGMLALVVAAAGCGGESLGGSGQAGSGGSSGTGGAPGWGGTPGCNAEVVVSVGSPRADVLIVMDRASSMNDDGNEMTCSGGCGATSKWSVAATAVDNLVSQSSGVEWALALYGVDDQCTAGFGTSVGLGLDDGPAIAMALEGPALGGLAPTAATIAQGAAWLRSQYNQGQARYLLLVTDGTPGCDASAADAANAAADAQAAGVATVVLGLAPSWDAQAASGLNQIAASGGLPLAGGANAFYTPAELGPDFFSAKYSCTVEVPYPPDAAQAFDVALWLTDETNLQVPESPTNGWAFTDSTFSTIVLSGSYCAEVEAGTSLSVSFQFTCDPAGHGTALDRAD